MIKAIIIDDDVECVNLVRGVLNTYCGEVQVIATAKNINEAVTCINIHKPDVIFLDIELNGEIGFDLFKFFPSPEFKVVFTTSHEKFAIRAIKSACLDFILKPIDPEQMIIAVQKIKESIRTRENFPILLSNFYNSSKAINRIAIPTVKEFVFIDIERILCFHGEGKYTTIYSTNNEKIIASKNIGEYEEILDQNIFYRCHRAWIINLKFARRFLKETSQVEMSVDILADVSLRKREDLIRLFSKA